MALNEQQERFCQSYILHRNASEAARAAGYSKEHAARQGHRLLQNEEVIERITELEQNLTTCVDRDWETYTTDKIFLVVHLMPY